MKLFICIIAALCFQVSLARHHLRHNVKPSINLREAVEQGACARELEKFESEGKHLLGARKPQCREDGSYHPRQCHEAVCYCVNSEGKPTGESEDLSKASEMNCHCAHDKADHESSGLLGKMFNCDALGNYEPIQCLGSICHCVNEHGHKLEGSKEVSIGEMHTLKCTEEEQGPCAQEIEILGGASELIGSYKPECNDDGYYHARQCRESGCMCVDREGNPTGHEAHISMASKMTCKCAQDQAEYFRKGLFGKAFNCDELGNYEAIQCIGSVCHCVNEHGQKLQNSKEVSIGEISTLKCGQEAEEMGACARELEDLGAPEFVGGYRPTCAEDGSYAPRQCRESGCMCVDREGNPTKIDAHISQASKMSCRCAQDKAEYQKKGIKGKTYRCDQLGNYEPIQCLGSVCHCVNEHGQKLEGTKQVSIGQISTLKCGQEEEEKGACARELEDLGSASELDGSYRPTCAEDGSYAPRQCRESACMCVDREGNPAGIEGHVSQASKMSCRCAQDKAEYKKKGMMGKSYRCDQLGNYEPIQCLGSVCHCVNEHGQKLEGTKQVSIGQISTLKCGQEEEEVKGACARELEDLGTAAELEGSYRPTCAEDGSYSPRQCRESACMCVDREGNPAGIEGHVSQAAHMSCQCAQDKAEYHKTGMRGKTFQCDELGNYAPVQCIGSVCHCVDPLGKKLEAVESVPITEISKLNCERLSVKRQAVEQGACARELEKLEAEPHGLGAFKPVCLDDGAYHPRQCQGSVCFCVDSAGLKTNYLAHISKASQMGCECAQAKADYLKTGLIGKLFMCDDFGNYKKQEEEVPEVDGPCAREVAKLQHGKPLMGKHVPQCNEKGGYKPLQCRESVCYCVDSEGKHIGNYMHVSKASQTNCQCAHDKAEYGKKTIIGKMFNCDKFGSYEKIQCAGSMCHCVDEKGQMLDGAKMVPIGQMSELKC